MVAAKIVDRDLGWKALREAVAKSGPTAAKVGILEEAGAHERSVDLTVAQVAAVNEYGTSDGHIPERPAWRNALDGAKDRITKTLQRAAGELLDGVPVTTAFGKVGLFGQALIRRGIDALTTPPNAPRTIAQKGSSKPLIDTAQTRNAVTFAVLQGGEVDEARRARGIR